MKQEKINKISEIKKEYDSDIEMHKMDKQQYIIIQQGSERSVILEVYDFFTNYPSRPKLVTNDLLSYLIQNKRILF